MNKPNIVFLTIDSLRSDKVYGKEKHSQIPNIEKIINSGIFFPNTISPADATDPGLSSIFTGKYPFNHEITLFQNHQKASVMFDYFKQLGYYRYSMLPNKTFFNILSQNFENAEKYGIDPYTLLCEGTGNRIIKKLESKSFLEPWIYYIHLMDLHPSGNKFIFPESFNKSIYGKNDYEKCLSSIDFWIGQFLEKIDLTNTIIILTSDHGDFIPDSGKRIDDIYSIQKKLLPLKKILPFDNFWELNMKLVKSIIKIINTKKINKENNEIKKRTYFSRTKENLYDESIRVPLIFFGPELNSKKIIHEQVSLIDIFPSIANLIDKSLPKNIDGINLLPQITNDILKSRILYFESASTKPNKKGIAFGIRTQEYKYFRTRDKSIVHLYNLRDDPQEQTNLAKCNIEQASKLEKILQSFEYKNSEKDKIRKIIKKNKL